MKCWTLVSAGLLACLATLQVAGQVVLYDNTSSSWTFIQPTTGDTEEYGDEITLAASTPRDVGTFVIQYGATGLTGGETVSVRFYKNDGPVSAQGAPTPGTLFFEQDNLPVSNGSRQTLTLQNLNVTVPDDFTWTLQFTGTTGGESVGPGLNSVPSVGSSYNDYWARTSGGQWNLYTNSDPSKVANFTAQLTSTVPEPGPTLLIAGFGLGVFAVTWSLARRTRTTG